MKFNSYKIADLQNFRAFISEAKEIGITNINEIDEMIIYLLSGYQTQNITGHMRTRKPDNITTCSVCGHSAVIVQLNRSDRTINSTHAIQCQNRPATNKPWVDGMCGHTEYLVIK